MYYVRVLIEPQLSEETARKTELRRSLKTNCPILAGKIVATINAVLANVPMSARPAVYDQIHDQALSRFMRQETQGMRIENQEDLQNFFGFFDDLNQPGLEDFKGVFTERVAKRGVYTQAPAFTVRNHEDRVLVIEMMKELAHPGRADLKEALLARLRGRPIEGMQATDSPAPKSSVDSPPPALAVVSQLEVPVSPHVTSPKTVAPELLPSPAAAPFRTLPASDPVSEVDNPTKWSKSVDEYIKSMKSQKKRGNDKTLSERRTLFGQFENFMVSMFGFSPDFYVHAVKKFHVSAFLDESASRQARGVTRKQIEELAPGKSLPTIAAATMLKRISSLESFFVWAHKSVSMTNINAAADLEDRRAAHKQDQSENSESYEPFTAGHLLSIFNPVRYLEQCRDADHFWVPLLGAHLGCRLGEVVRVSLDQIRQHSISQIWYIDITPEDAKNKNSVRRLPVTQALIDLGFIDYVCRLKELGAKTLFPHRNMNTVSAQRQPSKNVSEKFAKYLDVCQITDRKLVFHSFRHTLINSLMHNGVPLTICQQIVGHMAQDEAVRKGIITEDQARSVTLTVYTHKSIPSMHVADPFQMLKDTLEKGFQLPLDYVRLKKAAGIVLQHVRKDPKSSTGFDCGWAPQNAIYTSKVLKNL